MSDSLITDTALPIRLACVGTLEATTIISSTMTGGGGLSAATAGVNGKAKATNPNHIERHAPTRAIRENGFNLVLRWPLILERNGRLEYRIGLRTDKYEQTLGLFAFPYVEYSGSLNNRNFNYRCEASIRISLISRTSDSLCNPSLTGGLLLMIIINKVQRGRKCRSPGGRGAIAFCMPQISESLALYDLEAR